MQVFRELRQSVTNCTLRRSCAQHLRSARRTTEARTSVTSFAQLLVARDRRADRLRRCSHFFALRVPHQSSQRCCV